MAAVDVATSNGWLRPALVAMELCQMIVQATPPHSNSLLQLPYASEEFVTKAQDLGIKEVFDVLSCEDSARDKLFESMNFNSRQIEDIATACNNFPVVDLEHEVLARESKLRVKISRDFDDETNPVVPPVSAPLFPTKKVEQWWLVVGKVETNNVVAIRRLAINKPNMEVELELDTSVLAAKEESMTDSPLAAQKHQLSLFLMSDSYVGCDQEIKFTYKI
eukprot:Protomagalhaensia_wolfi_Nauph_80__3843@NODE_3895_length_684_cov_2_840310_g3079_i0_p1_GENE_NODE_3895_length_684_cov_2_840310_g3079_i0NODE_3895_length_684_cov_2_840310_g3079_i0_p1_ORF_typecomplete_len220_score43_72Sec63/PF02889_16/1_4e42_NODE_3895_length_684_cov_2_840310_g3079_i03662